MKPGRVKGRDLFAELEMREEGTNNVQHVDEVQKLMAL